ncbi:hypothetical protein H2200_003144 [Cladophialophora chaetospira]|uniref:Uncharacterized protein n=1 Tax=Cladophialophora chaetospira TaxID=386627 RepID=A0AA39CMG4_9EURO|nr:hypothetical protein H2200_003144 [Cladophialophora chaetospira]
MDISDPIFLAKLPRSKKQDGFHFGTVYAVRNGLKKRRKEICAAVDGDSLSLYETQNGHVIASYPVPPTSLFLGPLCSIHEKVGGRNIRTTYCVIKRDALRIEAYKTSREDSDRPICVVSPALRDQQSPVALLDVVLESRDNPIIVVQQNGNLTVFSADLQTTIIETSLSSKHLESLKVLAIHILTLSEAQKTVLKQRPDVTSAAAPHTCHLAVAYGQTGQTGSIDNLNYGVWEIENAGGNATSKGRYLKPLFEHDLSQSISQPNLLTGKHCSFSSRASNLFVHVGQTLSSYDLTGFVPSLSSTLHMGSGGTCETMGISPAFALGSFQDSLRLYDLKYQSVQAQRDTQQANLKRKRSVAPPDGSGPIHFIAYYPQSTRIIGRRRNQLLAIDLNMIASKRMLENGSDLLHNIGRGSSTQGSAAKSTANWKTVQTKLDDLAQAGDVAGFERAFIDDLPRIGAQAASADPTLDELLTEHAAPSEHKINYLLSTIFQVESSSNGAVNGRSAGDKQLKLRIASFKLMFWVSHLGLLSRHRVNSAATNATPDVKDGFPTNAVARALMDAGPSCALLIGCLKHGFSPDVDEQAAVVQLLIQRALETSANTSNAGSGSQADGTMDVDLALTAATQVKTFSTSSSESPWLPNSLQEALIAALDNFGTAASPTVSSTLKAVFSQTEILALIQFLRQQLFQAGHTRSFQSLPTTETVQRTVRFDVSIKVLSGCVDAIGPLGFFGAVDDEDFLGNIIPELVTEVTNTKQSLEEVLELQGILREALRYQESIQRQQEAGARIPPHIAGRISQQRPGAIVTVYSEAVEGGEDLQGGSALPLSLKVENVVNPVRMRKGGGPVKQRTLRQKRMLETRNKGQYSFERLVL